MDSIVAIVIPAYKSRFLRYTLQSLVLQSSKNFNVYIGDDGSPDHIEEIVADFKGELNIKYKRFKENLGSISLTSHWNRCISLIQNEKWIWLLPDDDVASEDCIESFLEAIQKGNTEDRLYRFQTNHIDENGKLLFETRSCPPFENNVDFLINKLKYLRSSSVAEYIFPQNLYKLSGGFVDLPLAWGSDDLMWISLSQRNDIITLPKGKVYLRQSSLNISANITNHTKKKFYAKYMFFEILLNNMNFLEKLQQKMTINQFKKIITDHLFFEYESYKLHFFNYNLFLFANLNTRLIGGGVLKNCYRLLRFDLNQRLKAYFK